MIDLRLNHDNIDEVAQLWEERLHRYLFEPGFKEKKIQQLTSKKYDTFTPYYDYFLEKIKRETKINKATLRRVFAYFKTNFHSVILADEKELRKLASVSNPISLKGKNFEFFKDLMKGLYSDFTNDYGYEFFKILDIRTCPYCNRQFVFTCDRKIKTRPEYDHFYDKSEYPLLAVSFYNLVPSCHVCNHVKGTKHIKLNPYFRGFKSKFLIADKDKYKKAMNANKALNLKTEKDFCLKYSHPTKHEKANIKNLGLDELYNEHKDYVLDIIEKAVSYNDGYKESLLDSMAVSDYSLMNVHDFVWGKYLEVANQEKMPLSKLTKDILDQLDIKR